jgi:hypothetical protein
VGGHSTIAWETAAVRDAEPGISLPFTEKFTELLLTLKKGEWRKSSC